MRIRLPVLAFGALLLAAAAVIAAVPFPLGPSDQDCPDIAGPNGPLDTSCGRTPSVHHFAVAGVVGGVGVVVVVAGML